MWQVWRGPTIMVWVVASYVLPTDTISRLSGGDATGRDVSGPANRSAPPSARMAGPSRTASGMLERPAAYLHWPYSALVAALYALAIPCQACPMLRANAPAAGRGLQRCPKRLVSLVMSADVGE